MLMFAFSYPRLTLDFHTNKRIIDEVVSPAINVHVLMC
jgi:ribosomal protein S17E